MKDKIKLNKNYLTEMGKKAIISHVGATRPGSLILCDYSVTGLIVDKESHGVQEQVAHYAEWDEYGVNKNSNNNLVESCSDKMDDLLIDSFL